MKSTNYSLLRIVILCLIIHLQNNLSQTILVSRTFTQQSTQIFDCVHYTNVSGHIQSIPYCRRPNESVQLNHTDSDVKCYNNGSWFSFTNLRNTNLTAEQLLNWNSSVDAVDAYAAFLNGISVAIDGICNCTISGTFGRRCEYVLQSKSSVEEAIVYQFSLKQQYKIGSQLYGNRTCYITLTTCDAGATCLDWRNICDGKQQCLDGSDEDHCEQMFYSKCSDPDHEYRCQHGQCIDSDFVLDGEIDCNDQSDEQRNYINFPHYDCWYSFNFDCEERLSITREHFSCGTGDVVFEEWTMKRYSEQNGVCSSFRDKQFMCELDIDHPMWTDSSNGNCLEMDMFSKYTEANICQFIIKCALTNGLSKACWCAGNDCRNQMRKANCSAVFPYPPEPVFVPFVRTYYEIYTHNFIQDKWPDLYRFVGSIRCRGYQVFVNDSDAQWTIINLEQLSSYIRSHYWRPFESIFCNNPFNLSGIQRNYSSKNKMYPSDCWNSTYNGRAAICPITNICISLYNIRDGYPDCPDGVDEPYTIAAFEKNKDFFMKSNCSDLANFRFRCSLHEETCFTVDIIGNTYTECILSGNRDEYDAENEILFTNFQCLGKGSAVCRLRRDYIKNLTLSGSILLLGDGMIQLRAGQSISFWQYCDTRWDLEYGMDERSELCGTEEWICSSDYYQCSHSGQCIPKDWLCNGVWDCNDGSDEEGFQLISNLSDHNIHIVTDLAAMKAKCLEANENHAFQKYCNLSTEYACLLATHSYSLNFSRNRPCISLSKIGDGTSDCYGSLDERNLLSCSAQKQVGFEFQCYPNQPNSNCLFNSALCNIERCSNGYDELLCKTQVSSADNRAHRCDGSIAGIYDRNLDIHCYNGTCKLGAKCNDKCECDDCEDEYYCITGRYYATYRAYTMYYKYEFKPRLREYPNSDRLNQTKENRIEKSAVKSNLDITESALINQQEQARNYSFEGWVCNRGLAVHESTSGQIQCLCPPQYYGRWCQYMSDRISVIVSFDDTSHSLQHPIKILATLISTRNDTVLSHHEFHFTPALKDFENKHRFYLVYPRPRYPSGRQFVHQIRFEAYQLFSNATLTLLSVWQYPIQFDFLPAPRIAKVLRYYAPHLMNYTNHVCFSSTTNPCLNNAQCHPLMSTNDSEAYWCECHNMTWGKRCEHWTNACSSISCASGSICRPNEDGFEQLICLCPINRHGPTCHLYRQCDPLKGRNPCAPNGQCHVRFDPDYLVEDYVCTCQFGFFGSLCEFPSSTIYLDYNESENKPFAVAILQLCDFDVKLNLLVQKQILYTNTWPRVDTIIYDKQFSPPIAIMQILENDGYIVNDNNRIRLKSSWYLVYSRSDQEIINISIILTSTNRCPSAYELLNATESSIKANNLVFKYHSLCRHNINRICFYDANYFCLCDVTRRAECFRQDHSVYTCHHCLAGGHCFQGSLTDLTDFMCLCPRCHFGSICQHNTQVFSFSLESLLTNDMFARRTSLQIIAVCSYVITVLLLFCLGFINNICSVLTFNRPKVRKLGTGCYLLWNSLVAQLSLFWLLIKIVFIILNTRSVIKSFAVNNILCKIITFLLLTSTRTTYWLTGFVTIERVYVTLYPRGIWFKKPFTAKCLIVIIFILTAASHIHDLLYYGIVQDPKYPDRGFWCVARYSPFATQFNRANVLLHHIAPFALHFICTLSLIIVISRKRALATGTNATHLFRKQVIEHKELFIPACFIIFSALPQFIISFSLACTDYNQVWQRYPLLIAYFLSFTPQTFTFILYIQPSTLFKEEFHQTSIGRKWFNNQNNGCCRIFRAHQ